MKVWRNDFSWLRTEELIFFPKFSFELTPLFNYGKGRACIISDILGCHLFLWSPCPRLGSVAGCQSEHWAPGKNAHYSSLNQISMWEVCDLGQRWKDPTSCSSQAQFWSLCEKRIPQKSNCESECNGCQKRLQRCLFWKSHVHPSGCEQGIHVCASAQEGQQDSSISFEWKFLCVNCLSSLPLPWYLLKRKRL